MVGIRQTETFADWFRNLRDRRVRARIQVRIDRLSLGNPGDAKPIGKGVFGASHRLRPGLPGLFRPPR
jgi:putative addiction module killer protein